MSNSHARAKSNDRIRSGFTLIELLVVVAIIALLISMLLPSLRCAREQAKAAKCGAQLRSVGAGLHSYFSENLDWIPGVNTTGVNFEIGYRARSDKVTYLRTAAAVQKYDWISACIAGNNLGNNRAQRFQSLVNGFACPSNAGLTSVLYPTGLSGVDDAADFLALAENNWTPLSYLMPAFFQFWGQQDVVSFGTHGGVNILAVVAPATFEVSVQRYRSKLTSVGMPASKIAAAEGTRYLDSTQLLDHDVSLALDEGVTSPSFGSFSDGGAWWAGSTAFGVNVGTRNWDNVSISRGSPAGGNNLALTYRHGCGGLSAQPRSAQDNQGAINAMFFDGHISRLNDRQSRNFQYWYPKGAIVNDSAGEIMTNVAPGTEVP